MRKKQNTNPLLFLSVISLPAISMVLSSPCQGAAADPKYQAYLDALKVAQRKVMRSRSSAVTASSAASSLFTTIPNGILGRPFHVGDFWEVAALRTDSPMMRMTSEPRHLNTPRGRVGLFRYEVKDVQDSGEITIEVNQVNKPGFKPIDPRVERLTLKMDQKTVQTEKKYFARGVENPIPVAPEGLRSAMTLLELYPLDVPEIFTAEKKSPSSFPDLPEELARIRNMAAVPVDLSKSVWFEQDDFFGRPVQVLWQKGDPWPAYLRTSNGIAILMSKGES